MSEIEILINSVLLVSNKVFHYRVAIYNRLNAFLRDVGYELTVLTNEVQDDNPHQPEFRLIIKPFGFADYKSIVTELDPAVVILFMHIKDVVVWPLLFWLRRKGKKVIYWNHGVNLQDPHNRLRNLIFGVFHRSADAILLYSENEMKYVAPKYRDKIFIANNTLDFGTFPTIRETPDAIRASLGIEFGKVVLFVGRIDDKKRLDDLILASQFLDDGIGIVIVGGGLTATQRAIIDGKAMIRYLGEIYDTEQINRIFKMADVFSIPGKMGLGINQAMYWGLPVVTEQVLHSPEIAYLKNEVNGFIVAKGDIQALAEKINFLLSSREIYDQFSKAAQREVERNATVEKMCSGFVQAIDYVQRS